MQRQQQQTHHHRRHHWQQQQLQEGLGAELELEVELLTRWRATYLAQFRKRRGQMLPSDHQRRRLGE